MQIILASGSPRRKEILESLGLEISIVKPDIEEAKLPGENFIAYSRRVAQEKSHKVSLELQNVLPEENLIISCDTDVILGKKILGKPRDQNDARKMIKELKNRKHCVISALSIIHNTPKIRRKGIAHTISIVCFNEYDTITIEKYLDTLEWQGKAGSYAIQGFGSYFINWYQGSFTSIIGFPLRLFFRMLIGMEIDILSMWKNSNTEF